MENNVENLNKAMNKPEVKLTDAELQRLKELLNELNNLKLSMAELRASFLLKEEIVLKRLTAVDNDYKKEIQYILKKNKKTKVNSVDVDWNNKKLILK